MIDGPRIAPLSGGPAKSLVIFVHGYGANGQDLLGLAPHWQQMLPDTAFVSPNAPQPCDGNPGGYQWFPITIRAPGEGWRPPAEAWEGIISAAPQLDGFITQELEALGLDETKLVLVGFSQGTLMSLHVGLRRSIAPAGILGYSGAFEGADHADEVTARPPVFLIHGDQDPMIPVQAMFDAAGVLSKVDVTAQWHVSPGVPHSIGPDGLDLGGKFVAACLTKPRSD